MTKEEFSAMLKNALENTLKTSRVIEFRGKQKNSKEWCYGFYTPMIFVEDYEVLPCIVVLHAEGMYFEPVIPETIGQYTGLLDKNGKKIFEGDIVDMHRKGCSFKPIECVEYWKGGFNPVSVAGWECTPEPNEIEVIGNIHDNPELLKGGADNDSI